MKNKSYKVNQISYISNFQCLADKCPDDCCSKWAIDVTDENKEFYDKNAKEITDFIEERHDSGFKMQKKEDDSCIWFEDKLCKIHGQYGEEFLPDICHSFPNSFRKFADQVYTVPNLACPESLRMALYNKDENGFSWKEVNLNRIKSNLFDFKDRGFKDLNDSQVIDIFNSVIASVDDSNLTSSEMLAKLLIIADNLDDNDIQSWHIVKERILKLVNKSHVQNISDHYLQNININKEICNLLKAAFVVINRDRQRYNYVLNIINEVLGNDYDDEDKIWNNYQKIKNKWQENEKDFEPILKNLIKAQISYVMFPIACYFYKKYHSAIVIVLEYLVVKLALMCRNYQLDGNLNVEDVIDIIQPIARRFYVRKKQELFDFCDDIGWDDDNKLVSIILNF